MDIRLLGPVEASVGGQPLALGAGKPRALLALLALDAGSTVSSDRLIAGLWGDEPPATATKMVQLYVSGLRKALAANGNGDRARIITRGHGYELRLGDDDEVDARRFQDLVARGLPREALSLWRGPPLDDVSHEPFATAEIRRLWELRLGAVEFAIDQDLTAGRERQALVELEALVLAHPLRERLHAQRMLALYRSGRQSEALEAYRHARSALVQAIGVEPGPELRRLHEAILRQEPSLERSVPQGGGRLSGREAELDRLREHWRRSRGGAGHMVLLTGPPGIGKTALAAAFADEVHDGGGAVRWTSAGSAAAAAGAAHEPTLLVVDDAAGGPPVEIAAELAGRRVLVLATADHPPLPDVLATSAGSSPASAPAAVHPPPSGLAALTLGTLDAAGVRAIASFYAGARDDVAVPVGRLLAETGGVPRELHRAASEWARTLAARRIGDAAGRIAAERPVLRSAEDELAGTVVAFQAANERVQGPDLRAEEIVVCPFKGLASFGVADAPFFFGRERLVAEAIARLMGAPLTGIIGASGSGKSSLLRAGLLGALEAGVLPGSEGWGVALLRPGEHPLKELERATFAAQPGGDLVIAVDQFEELFTACRTEAERAAFADALVAHAREPRRRVLILVAVRADFYGRCAAYPELARLLAANHVLVGPMRRDELRRAIELPAARAGLSVEPDLADALLRDIEDEPGALPLLSTALLELWQQRDGRRLRLAAYERSGGVHGAVSRLAERSYERLDPAQRPVARRILLRLAGEGDGESVVRRRVAPEELERRGAREEVREVLAVLADDRLVTVGEGAVEVAHEALLREWTRLREWLEEDAESRRLRRHLRTAAHEWDAGGRDTGELYRGGRLASALDWIDGREDELSSVERQFIDRSRAAAAREGERQRQANRRLRTLLGALAALLALAVVAGAVAISQRGQARDVAVTADAQRLGALATTRDGLDQAMLLAAAGVGLDDSPSTRGNLVSVLGRTPAAIGVLRGDGWPLFTVAASRDGRLAAIGSERGTVTVFDAITRRQLGRPYQLRDGLVHQLEFSPDGRTLAVTGQEPAPLPAGALVDLIDPRTQRRRVRIVLPRFPEPSAYVVASVKFLPDGRDVVVSQTHEGFNPSGPASVLRRFDGTTGRAESAPLRVGRHSTLDLFPTTDRRRVFLTNPVDDATYEIDAEELEITRRWPVGDFTGDISPDGRSFALGSEKGDVRVLDLRSGRVRSFAGRHEGGMIRLRFTPDGRRLVSTGEADGRLNLWDVARGEIADTFVGHERGNVWGIAIPPDGRLVYSAGSDGRTYVWDLAGDRRLDRPFNAGPPFDARDGASTPRGMAVSPDNKTLAVTQSDGSVTLIDARTLRRRGRVRALRGFAAAVAFSPNGSLLAVTGEGGELRLFDARTGRAAGALKGLHGTSQTLAFSPDGTRIAAASLGTSETNAPTTARGSRLQVWDVRRRAPTRVHSTVTSGAIAYSPDGRLLAAAGLEDGTEVRDADTGALVARLRNRDLARSVAFAPGGDLVATGEYDGTGQLWSTRTWQRVGPALEGHSGRITGLQFSLDGTVVTTSGADGTLRHWDVDSQKPIGAPMTIDPARFLAMALSPDGSQLFAASDLHRGVRWDTRATSWKRHACRVAGRAMTRGEWEDVLPERAYRPVCAPG